jgi:hypothetical protein
MERCPTVEKAIIVVAVADARRLVVWNVQS